jgi:hypothetical protein
MARFMRHGGGFFKNTSLGRRPFLKLGAATGAGAYLFHKFGLVRRARAAPLPGGTLDPTLIRKYAMPLVILPAMPKTSTIGKMDYYEIAVRRFQQQILPTGMPKTTVWSYGSVNHSETFNYPAFTIEAKVRKPVRVKWINELVDEKGRFLPHILPVDPTLHWANPPGRDDGRATSPRTPTRSTFTRFSSKLSSAKPSTAKHARRNSGDGLQGYSDRLSGGDHPGQGPLRPARAVRLALPHRRARGQRDDAAILHRAPAAGGRGARPGG